MAKKLQTINLQGSEYAKVPTRIKEFREKCPFGTIDTQPTYLPDGWVEFKTVIVKDGNTPNVGRGTGHARGLLFDKNGKEIPKAYEKLETISIGRALGVLGFMASGEVASFEEMEDFLTQKEADKQLKIQEIKAKVDSITSIEELREYFKTVRGFGIEVDSYVMEKSKQLKANQK